MNFTKLNLIVNLVCGVFLLGVIFYDNSSLSYYDFFLLCIAMLCFFRVFNNI